VIEIANGGAGHLHVTAHLASLASLIDVSTRARRIAGLDQPASATRHLRGDPLLRGMVGKAPRMRVPGAWDAFEVSVRIIVGQQISVRGASTIAGRIGRAFGAPVAGVEVLGLTHTFPAAERVAALRMEQLRTIGLTQSRAESVRGFARAYADGRLALDGSQTLHDLVTSLRELPGIGPWSAQLIAMRAGSYMDAFPAEDLGLRRAAGVMLGREGELTAAELAERAEAWRPYRALAAMHLWASLGR
jgi:AraC family transcriptional regulator of adaptative response / DNA-3-methyladenine glycosylase II